MHSPSSPWSRDRKAATGCFPTGLDQMIGQHGHSAGDLNAASSSVGAARCLGICTQPPSVE
ncbi:hypothetical protein N7490_006818 [Penicillium lividum]|nr:hypothetical protein N7490_006818 [Penicillium lividum]